MNFETLGMWAPYDRTTIATTQVVLHFGDICDVDLSGTLLGRVTKLLLNNRVFGSDLKARIEAHLASFLADRCVIASTAPMFEVRAWRVPTVAGANRFGRSG